MEDFSLEPDVADRRLDDELFAKTTERGGILAGSNPRSVLLSVYRFLRQQGCLWLFPGPDGESIPLVEGLSPVTLHHKASFRCRGQCNEGSQTQSMVLDAIDFTPKLGLNTFMLEFDIPKYYYQQAVSHRSDPYDPEAPLSNETVLQWKRQCEAEIAKRGLMFHDMGHGWTAEPFGFDSSEGWVSDEKPALTQEQTRHLAQLNGVRQLYGGVALNTNVCMSDPETRLTIARYAANYARTQNNVDFLHVWLADAGNNHCECDACRKKTTSDWYVCLLNDIDAQLTALGSDVRIVFIAYMDTLWAPKEETLHDPKRFTMLFAPITRKYTETYGAEPNFGALTPYVRNRTEPPKGMADMLAYLYDWKKMWKGDCICYEYHLFSAQYYDLSVLNLARTLYADIHSLRKHGLTGMIEDCSQASYFPNGFLFYVYAESLLDENKRFETMLEEYFSHAYGADWRQAAEYLTKLRKFNTLGFARGECSADPAVGKFYAPAAAKDFPQLSAIADAFLPVIEAHLKSPKRCQYVSWELLKWHAAYVKLCQKGFSAIAVDDKEVAFQCFLELVNTMAPLRYLRSACYDHELCCCSLGLCLDPNQKYSALKNV